MPTPRRTLKCICDDNPGCDRKDTVLSVPGNLSDFENS